MITNCSEKYKTLNLRNDLMEFNSFPDESFQIDRYSDFFVEFPDYTLPAHWHDQFEIDIVINEAATYYINGNPYIVKKGDTILINSKRMHYAIGNNANSRALGFIFNPESVSNDVHSTIYQKYFYRFIHSEVDAIVLTPSESADVWQMVYDIYNMDEKSIMYEISCLEKIIRIWHAFFEKYETIKNPEQLPDRQSELLIDMITYMHNHYSEKITIEQLASIAKTSPSGCFRMFKQYTSTSPIAYLNDYRLRVAALALKSTTKSITDIASDCGFENQSYFTLLFKKKYNISPLKYRKRS